MAQVSRTDGGYVRAELHGESVIDPDDPAAGRLEMRLHRPRVRGMEKQANNPTTRSRT